jgi:hypothetical protein
MDREEKLAIVLEGLKQIIWLNEFASFEEAKEKIGRWIHESRGV